MTANSLIDLSLEEIARGYQPGVLPWMKADKPKEWNEMIALEKKINDEAVKEDVEGLKETLRRYKVLIQIMVKKFRTPKGESGNLFNQGG